LPPAAPGQYGGWGHVLMSRLPGIPLDTVRDQLSAADRDRLAGQLGETIAALHQLPPPVIRDRWPADWPAFVAGQRKLRPQVEAVLPLDQVREALARVAGRHTRGKIVLQIGP
jgi:hypothetical protein